MRRVGPRAGGWSECLPHVCGTCCRAAATQEWKEWCREQQPSQRVGEAGGCVRGSGARARVRRRAAGATALHDAWRAKTAAGAGGEQRGRIAGASRPGTRGGARQGPVQHT
jgi:hypothetical protein